MWLLHFDIMLKCLLYLICFSDKVFASLCFNCNVFASVCFNVEVFTSLDLFYFEVSVLVLMYMLHWILYTFELFAFKDTEVLIFKYVF